MKWFEQGQYSDEAALVMTGLFGLWIVCYNTNGSVQRRPGDTQRLANGGDVGPALVIHPLCQGELLWIGQLFRATAESPARAGSS